MCGYLTFVSRCMQTYYTGPSYKLGQILYRYSHLHFKSEMSIPSGYIYVCILPITYTLIIQTYEPDVRRGGGIGRKI